MVDNLSIKTLKEKISNKNRNRIDKTEVVPIDYQNSNWRERNTRRVSIYLTWVLVHTNVTPIQITWGGMILGLTSVVFFVFGSYVLSIIGLLFFTLGIIIDHCDGEVARYKNILVMKAHYLDTVSHVIVNPLIIMGISVGVFLNNQSYSGSHTLLIFGFLGSYGYMLTHLVTTKRYQSYVKVDGFKELRRLYAYKKKRKVERGFVAEVKGFFVIDNIINALFFFTILGVLPYLIIIWGVILPINAVTNLKKTLRRG